MRRPPFKLGDDISYLSSDVKGRAREKVGIVEDGVSSTYHTLPIAKEASRSYWMSFSRWRSRKVNMCLCRIGEAVTVPNIQNWGGGYGV